jgi:plasmid stability protein
MGQILLRNLDDAVIARVKARRSAKTSLEKVLRQILTEAAKLIQSKVVAEIDVLRKQIGPVSANSTDFIREDRDNDEPCR